MDNPENASETANPGFAPPDSSAQRSEIAALLAVARRVRTNLLRADYEVGRGDGSSDDLLCDLAVRALREVLVDHDTIYHVARVYAPTKGEITDHWWVSVGDIMIDITAEQFGRSPVVVCHKREFPWPSLFSDRDYAACREYILPPEVQEEAAAYYQMDVEALDRRAQEHDERVLNRFRRLMSRPAALPPKSKERKADKERKAARRRAKEARRKTRKRR